MILRPIAVKDLEAIYYWSDPKHKWHQFDGPYFPKQKLPDTWVENKTKTFGIGKNVFENQRSIVDESDNIIGSVIWYWRSEETNWLEIGITIYDESNWGKGYGYQALKEWIDEVFSLFPNIVRIGLTTWSGNKGMTKLSKKLGLYEEARYKNARVVDNNYHDSVSFGIQKDEWNKLKNRL